jgi:hypothetical protein
MATFSRPDVQGMARDSPASEIPRTERGDVMTILYDIILMTAVFVVADWAIRSFLDFFNEIMDK